MTSQEAIRILDEQRNKFMDEYVDYGGVNEAYNMAIQALKEQEAVVRCKDCKYGEQWGVLIGCGTSKGFGITHNPDWFCADGERR